MRSPDDSPLRDGNRDRLIGMLTERAAKTLLVYLQEMNPTMYHWLHIYLKENLIPLMGPWDEVSGDAFLRKMLNAPPESTTMGRNEYLVDPRQMAQRIMEIRLQLSREFIQDLSLVSDENSVLLRETLQASLANALQDDPHPNLPPRDVSKVFVHPELLVEGQGGASTLHPEVAESHPELLPVVKAKMAAAAQSPEPEPATPKPEASVPTPPAAAAAVDSLAVEAAPVSPPAPTPEAEVVKDVPQVDGEAATAASSVGQAQLDPAVPSPVATDALISDAAVAAGPAADKPPPVAPAQQAAESAPAADATTSTASAPEPAPQPPSEPQQQPEAPSSTDA